MATAPKNRRMNLPAGIQSFPALRKSSALYFDKTPLIKQLLTGSRRYFLSRPAGFGKTLLLTALRSFFSGEAQAFSGLGLEKEALRNSAGSYEVIFVDLEEGTTAVENALARLDECEYAENPTVLLIDGFLPELPETDESLRKLLQKQKRLQHKLDFVMITGRDSMTGLTGNPAAYGLLDISDDPAFATICGLTPREIKRIPDDWLRQLAKNEGITITEARESLRETARSGRFAAGAPRVYSPSDILAAISSGSLKTEEFNAGEEEEIPLPPPNSSLLESMKEDLEEGRPDDFMVKLRAVFSSVAYGAVYTAEAERHFQTYVFLIVRLMGFQESELERLTSAGRIDMRVATERFIHIFEFKTSGSASAALSQIRSRGYLHADQADPRPVWLIGVNFSIARRSIADWKIAPGRKVR